MDTRSITTTKVTSNTAIVEDKDKTLGVLELVPIKEFEHKDDNCVIIRTSPALDISCASTDLVKDYLNLPSIQPVSGHILYSIFPLVVNNELEDKQMGSLATFLELVVVYFDLGSLPSPPLKWRRWRGILCLLNHQHTINFLITSR
jgi:hypothetical protein